MIDQAAIQTVIKGHKAMIAKYGRSVQIVFATEEQPDFPSFAYTIGNCLQNLPELIAFGPQPAIGRMLNIWSEHMKHIGREYFDGEFVKAGNAPLPVLALHIHPADFSKVTDEYTSWIENVVGHHDYRLIQILAPDTKGVFGSHAADPWGTYPILGHVPVYMES